MKRSFLPLALAVPLLAGSVASARDLPNVDAYASARPRKPAARAGAALPVRFAGSLDEQRGVPAFLWATRSPGAPSPVAGLPPEAAARVHLAQHAAVYGLSSAALGTAALVRVHDVGRGGILVVLRQQVGGVELFHVDVKILMDRKLDLVAIGGNLHAAAVPGTAAAAGFKRTPAQAVAAAFGDLYGVVAPPAGFTDTGRPRGGYDRFDLGAALARRGYRFSAPARVKPVFFPLPDRLVPAFFLELYAAEPGGGGPDSYAYVIAADDGRLLYRENLTHGEAFNYRVWADEAAGFRPADGPLADFTPHPTGVPDGSYPGPTAPVLIAMEGFNRNPNGKADPWLAAGAVESRGNNVDAFTDDGNDGFSPGGTDLRAAVTAPGTFDRAYDLGADPQASDGQRMASVTQLFYVTNWLHDWWYDSGFDEKDAVAQENDFGRGGRAGDPMWAQAQFNAPMSRNNSNMSVPGDGQSPVMRMFVWDGLRHASLALPPVSPGVDAGTADFGPQNFQLTAPVALVDDGTGTVTDACEPIANAVAGAVALVDRGTCSFKLKAVNAQAAGAVGVVIVDNKPNEPPPGMNDGPPAGVVTIPIMAISMADGDAVKAALPSGPVNATMSRTVAPDRDGTIDNSVVAHEWGHYLHLRHVACTSQQCLAQSEGWGDFDALSLVVRPEDDLRATFALAQYATQASADDPGYFGIRRYPYSTDTAKNPLTFQDISHGQALPVGPPIAPSLATLDNAEVHDAGEIWASMLFEGYAALLARSKAPSPPYTFEEARRRMSDYVIVGLSAAPVNPTYTEQRDAILAAAEAAHPEDFTVLALAFARRGAGTCAVSPARDSMDLTGVVEDFQIRPSFRLGAVTLDDRVTSCDGGDGYLQAGETGALDVTIVNTGTAPLAQGTLTVASSAPGVTFPRGTKAAFAPIAPFATGTATVEIALDRAEKKVENLALRVTVDSPDACNPTASIETAPHLNVREVPASSARDDVEAASTTFTLEGDLAAAIWSRAEVAPGQHAWVGVDFASPSDTSLVSPPLPVSPTAALVLSFDHRHQFESGMGTFWDGGVIELSTDGGKVWRDLATAGNPGYGGKIGDPKGMSANVLDGRQGYVAHNPSWPARDHVTVDLGHAFAGKTIQVRFRVGSDDAVGDLGWEVDNIALAGITATPFASLVPDGGACAKMQTADAGAPAGSGGSGGSGGAGGHAGGAAASDGPAEAFGGCGCRTAGASDEAPWALSLLGLAALGLRRRDGGRAVGGRVSGGRRRRTR